jgi:hypothetical protein
MLDLSRYGWHTPFDIRHYRAICAEENSSVHRKRCRVAKIIGEKLYRIRLGASLSPASKSFPPPRAFLSLGWRNRDAMSKMQWRPAPASQA